MEYIFVFIPKEHRPFFERTLDDVANVLKSIFYGHFLTAIVIGVMGGVGYYFLGYKFALFLGIVTGIAQLVPIFGPWIVYWALALYAFFVAGDIAQGILTILWGFVLSLSDMYIRPMLASNYADMPSLILLVGFMAGPYVFGIVGFILGPLILGIAYAVIKSLKEELEKDKLENEELENNESDDY
jgi:predicted PurR-regulated permease PerM